MHEINWQINWWGHICYTMTPFCSSLESSSFLHCFQRYRKLDRTQICMLRPLHQWAPSVTEWVFVTALAELHLMNGSEIIFIRGWKEPTSVREIKRSSFIPHTHVRHLSLFLLQDGYCWGGGGSSLFIIGDLREKLELQFIGSGWPANDVKNSESMIRW